MKSSNDMAAGRRLGRLSLLAALLAGGMGGAHAATTVFSYTGADQVYVVPSGVTKINVKAWGAGGAGGEPYLSDVGGGGGFVSGTLNVTPGEQLTIIVGGGGESGPGSGAYGGGGPKTVCGAGPGGRGGGRSAVRRASNAEVITAGAGGGGGRSATGYPPAHGGAGGGLAGAPSPWPGYSGDPGTQTQGGAGYGAGQPGGAFVGGDAPPQDDCGNGAGGGGYFGGGGGTDVGDGGGGGGSSLVPSGGTTVAGNGQTAANITDPDYANDAGRGGGPLAAGFPGRVVIQTFEIGGTVTEVGLQFVDCTNATTGQHFTLRMKQGTAWNCTAAGLVAHPGDKIVMRLTGKH